MLLGKAARELSFTSPMPTQWCLDRRNIAKNVRLAMFCVVIEYVLIENFRYMHWFCWRGSLLQEGGEDGGNEMHYSYVGCPFVAFIYTFFVLVWMDGSGVMGQGSGL